MEKIKSSAESQKSVGVIKLDWRSVAIISVLIALLTGQWWIPSFQSKKILVTWAGRPYDFSVQELERNPSVLVPRSEIPSLSNQIAVVNKSRIINDDEARRVVEALQKQVHRDFAPVWGIDAKLTYIERDRHFDKKQSYLLLLDDDPSFGALAYHETSKEVAVGKVFIKYIQDTKVSWSLVASHQLLEMLVDPRTNLTVFRQNKNTGSLYAYEVADPCQAEEYGYNIDGVLVSDFVFPTWFDDTREPNSTQFDFTLHIKKPFEILPGGYMSVINFPIPKNWQGWTMAGK